MPTGLIDQAEPAAITAAITAAHAAAHAAASTVTRALAAAALLLAATAAPAEVFRDPALQALLFEQAVKLKGAAQLPID